MRRITRRRTRRLVTHTPLAFLVYRYRYLAVFAAIGFVSILLELFLVHLMPADMPWTVRAGLAFIAGLVFSFALNARLNFDVPRSHLKATFGRFALVSTLSFGLNLLAISVLRLWLAQDYASARLVSSAALFLLAYRLHRLFTFDLTRNFGVAVYASAAERPSRIFAKIGRNCDHVHVDLVDETMNPAAAPVELGHLDQVRRLWPGIPVCLHVMSHTPAYWMCRAWDRVDWVLFHVGGSDDLFDLIAESRLRGKKVGVVWHVSNALTDMLPYLPHVDFVMVLGIAQPGKSGQKLLEEAVAVAETLDGMRPRYGFEVMFDGGVSVATLPRIRAKYIVSASAVLRATDPIRASHTLRTGARYDRRAA